MEKKNIKIILIPGNGGGTAQDNWFPYVRNTMESLGVTVIAKDFPDPILARQSYWLPFLKNELHAAQDTILIGHSTGAIAAMKYAETNSIFGSILVGTYYTDLGDENEKKSEYFNSPWKWEAIKRNQRWIVQYSSTDDPYIPIDEARYVNKQLGTEYYEYTDQGHFGSERQKKTFPELIQVLQTKIM